MAKKIFKYLIPVYLLWFIGHAIFFINFVLKYYNSENPPLMQMGLIMLSHFLIIVSGVSFTIYMVVDAVLRKYKDSNEKVIWIFVILLSNLVGAIVYYYAVGVKDKR